MTSKFVSKSNLSFTYQTRIDRNEDALSAYAELFGVLQRRLFADVCSGHPSASLKSDYIRRYGIPARMFNAINVTLEGRMSAARESQKLHRQTLDGLIAPRGETAQHSCWKSNAPASSTRSEGASPT